MNVIYLERDGYRMIVGADPVGVLSPEALDEVIIMDALIEAYLDKEFWDRLTAANIQFIQEFVIHPRLIIEMLMRQGWVLYIEESRHLLC